MSETLHVLFGAAFTVALCIAAGKILLRRLDLRFTALEDTLFAFVAGSAIISFLVFLLCSSHLARKGYVLWGGVVLLALALRYGRMPATISGSETRWSSVFSGSWIAVSLVIFAAYFFVYLTNAVAPEVSADGMGYHLGNVARTWRNFGFAWNFHSMYSYLSQGMEMLFLVGFFFGRYSAAATVHLAFQTALPLLIVSYGRRFGHPKAGLVAALLVYASPVVGLDGSSAYNDLALATVIFAVFYLLEVWDEEKSFKILFLIGVIAGFSYAIKYTAALAVPFAIVYVAWRGSRDPLWTKLRGGALIAAGASISMLPWMIRNWIWLGNPTAPFLNLWFPNPYYHPGMEQEYMAGLRQYYGIEHFWQIPLELTVGGELVNGLLGPTFLLCGLALLALRYPRGRRLLAAAAVFGVPALLNIGTRFLIPALPFVSLAMAIGLANYRGALPAIAVFHAVSCWPMLLPRYCDKYAWRIETIPVRAALRLEPEQEFLLRRRPEVAFKDLVEANTAPDEKIFAFNGIPDAYVARDIVVWYHSSFGNLLKDILWSPAAGYLPTHQTRFQFRPVQARGIRVIETEPAEVSWTLAEVRLLSEGKELPRESDWRLSASPNGWEVQLAFDNNYATRWSTCQKMEPGMSVQVEFGHSRTVDSVLLEYSATLEALVKFEVLQEDGRWVQLSGAYDESEVPSAPAGMRRAAILAVKAQGIHHMLVGDNDLLGKDFKFYPGFWGVTRVGRVGTTNFYRID